MKPHRLDYTNCPPHLQGGLQRYFEEKIATGSFLRAVLENNLVQTYQKADEANIQAPAMLQLLRWLYNEAPGIAWGSEEKVAKWLAGDCRHGISRVDRCFECDGNLGTEDRE
jgi:hypothetical protein